MDEMDHITKEERESLVGWCDKCEIWTHFKIEGTCSNCGGAFSKKQGKQITTERTWNPKK